MSLRLLLPAGSCLTLSRGYPRSGSILFYLDIMSCPLLKARIPLC